MPNPHKQPLLDLIRERFGELHKIPASQSLFSIGDDAAVIYVRYSKVHDLGRTFFGLRSTDLRQLEGRNSFLCFLLDNGSPPVFVPVRRFRGGFSICRAGRRRTIQSATLVTAKRTELYIARQGRFNVEGFVGYDSLARSLDANELREARDLTHAQVQTLLAGIGHAKGFDVWVPSDNVAMIDWSLTQPFSLAATSPEGFDSIRSVLRRN